MKPTLQLITLCVSDYFGIEEHILFSRTRRRNVVIPRQIFQYLACKRTSISSAKIGEFGGYLSNYSMDHATVLHSKKMIQNFIDIKDREIVKWVDDIDEEISRRLHLDNPLIVTDVNLLIQVIQHTLSLNINRAIAI
ncbi:helix-turn-helix domain-containing protein [Spongiimicrobium salis]|uniref:helix-turn-helix domain-containing protein n=1 Tax=Spongiimicrobium salis TaxID=1667022 RepID=UPI00374DE949